MAKNEFEIYFFIPYYPENTTGGNKYHSKVYEILKEKGKNVKIIGNENNFKKIENSKIKKIIYGLKVSAKIPRKSIIVLTNTAFLHFLIPLILFNIFKRHKYFIIIHHLLSDEKRIFLINFFEKLFIKLIENKITVSKTTEERLLFHNIINKKIPIINPGLNYLPDYKWIRKKCNRHFQLLFVGNVEKRKSLTTIINALDVLKNENYNLLIVGNLSDNDYYSELLNMIKTKKLQNNVRFFSKVSSQDLLLYYRTSDILLFPSLCEGFGMVIVEAMANGLPVISSNIPSSKELIDDRKNGLLFEVENYEKLANCIKELSCNEELYLKISINSVKKASEFHNWENTTQQVWNCIINSK